MGLSQFEPQAEGVLPLMVLNTIFYVVMLRDLMRSVLKVVGVVREGSGEAVEGRRVEVRRVESGISGGQNDCSVCLCGFKCGEVVSELSCKHFFHSGCLEKWFSNNGGNATCPLCRSLM